jgi:hypothetical protein
MCKILKFKNIIIQKYIYFINLNVLIIINDVLVSYIVQKDNLLY